MNQLTPDEAHVIIDKGTEAPFSGEYEKFFEDGIFACRQCGLPLFDAKAKFDAHCGWPSFDATFPQAVKEFVDADGERTEIVCTRCGGHLGHVFRGEKFTENDTRHCANSLSIKFVPKIQQEEYISKSENKLSPKDIVIGGGCSWCIDATMLRTPGVLDTIVGYSGGSKPNPTYEEVCTGETGHAEVVKVTYDEKALSLEKLLDFFFLVHDPTSLNKQGFDVGTEYRSVIFYNADEEKKRINEYIQKKQTEYSKKIVTEVTELDTFYEAEKYHQRYFEKNPYAGYCQFIVKPKIKKVLQKLAVPKA